MVVDILRNTVSATHRKRPVRSLCLYLTMVLDGNLLVAYWNSVSAKVHCSDLCTT